MGGCQNKSSTTNSSRSSDNISNFELNLHGDINSMATKWTSAETELLIQVFYLYLFFLINKLHT
jgi:hypothetical protein